MRYPYIFVIRVNIKTIGISRAGGGILIRLVAVPLHQAIITICNPIAVISQLDSLYRITANK